MKSTVIAALAFTALIGVSSISAQPLSTSVRAIIPFDFHAGRTVLPAGRYEIKGLDSGAIVMRRVDGVAAALMSAGMRSRSEAGELPGVIRFERYRGDYLLTEIFGRGMAAGMRAEVPKAWKEMRSATGAAGAPRTVEIAADNLAAR